MANVGAFPAGHVLCSFTAFFDFTLAAEYALLLSAFSIILVTRKFPRPDGALDQLSMEMEIIHHSPSNSIRSSQRNATSRQSGVRIPSRNETLVHHELRPPSVTFQGLRPNSSQALRSPSNQGSRAPSVQGSRPPSVQGSRAPSVAGSDGYKRLNQNQAFQPKKPVNKISQCMI